MSGTTNNLPLRLEVRVIIKRAGKICLCKRENENGKIYDYVVPGGGVEEGMSMEETVIKEVMEEVGLVVHRVKPLGIRLARYKQMDKDGRHLRYAGSDEHYFEADFLRIDKSSYNIEGDGMEYEWVEPKEAIRLIRTLQYNEVNAMKIQALEMIIPKEERDDKPAFLRW